MSKKERERKVILERVRSKGITLVEASRQLRISYRHVKRLWCRYREEGDKSLPHKNRGRCSNRSKPADFKALVLQRYQESYDGFGPTFASEKLTERDNLPVKAETLRLWLKQAGLWKQHRKRSPYRSRRAPKEAFGEMLQLDGSPHRWFGDNQPENCLMNLVDDASRVTIALLDKEETTAGAMEVLYQWVVRYGIPASIYVDLKNVYVSPKTLSADEEEDLPVAHTHFSKVCSKLGIQIIRAYSPQAKGRVERRHQVFQDRFVKELRLEKITSIEPANQLLQNSFLPQINQRFAIDPDTLPNAHRSLKAYGDLEQIFCWEFTRVMRNDWGFSFRNQLYQIDKTPTIKSLRPGKTLIVRQHRNNSLSVWFNDKRLHFYPIDKPIPKPVVKKGINAVARSQNASKNRHKTPWGRFNPHWLKSSSTALKAPSNQAL